MVRLWVRAISPRGRRLYLLVATALFLLSVSLLLLRSWGSGRPSHLLPPPAPVDSQQDSFYPAAPPDPPSQDQEPQYLNLSPQERHNAITKEEDRGLTWLVQISDLHLHTGEVEEVQHFQEFVDDAVNIVKPAAVLVTGDLTNSKVQGVRLVQLSQEWSIYQRSVKERLSLNNTAPWLDMVGNHDNFDEVKQAHFKAHAMQVNFDNSRTAQATVVRGSQGSHNITLLPVDASLKPGIRAYNFLGYLPENEYKDLEEESLKARARGDMVLFYGHYPTSTIVSSRDLRHLLAVGSAYLCGHLHTGFGFVDPMWTKHSPSGLLELELADWFHNHRYRILAIDDGRITWLDVTHPWWPVVILSNIKRYSTGQAAFRYIVRILVFSNEEIAAVSVRIDDNLGHWISCRHKAGPLYVATVDVQREAWEPLVSEADFIKNLQVLVGNSSGSKSLLRLSSEGASFTRPRPALLSSLLLSTNMHDLFLLLYVLGIGCCCFLLLLGKLQVRCELLLPRKMPATLTSLAQHPPTFLLLLLFLLYPFLGPWYVGHLAQDRVGLVFMWGIFVDSVVLPGELTYPDAFFLLITLQLPVFVILVVKKALSLERGRGVWCGRWLRAHMALVVVVQAPAVLAWLILDSILLTGPLRLLLAILALVLWRRV